jgi:hypothetical protein
MNPTASDAVAPLPPAGGQIVPAPQLPAQETDASWSQVKYWAATAAKCQPSTGQEKRGQNLHKCLIFLGFSAVFAGFRQIQVARRFKMARRRSADDDSFAWTSRRRAVPAPRSKCMPAKVFCRLTRKPLNQSACRCRFAFSFAASARNRRRLGGMIHNLWIADERQTNTNGRRTASTQRA